jgi:hypothetical protein
MNKNFNNKRELLPIPSDVTREKVVDMVKDIHRGFDKKRKCIIRQRRKVCWVGGTPYSGRQGYSVFSCSEYLRLANKTISLEKEMSRMSNMVVDSKREAITDKSFITGFFILG